MTDNVLVLTTAGSEAEARTLQINWSSAEWQLASI
jgi:hypothetical protein